jgi:hypothetical protein
LRIIIANDEKMKKGQNVNMKLRHISLSYHLYSFYLIVHLYNTQL